MLLAMINAEKQNILQELISFNLYAFYENENENNNIICYSPEKFYDKINDDMKFRKLLSESRELLYNVIINNYNQFNYKIIK